MKLINNRYQQHMDFDKYSSYFLIIENSKEYLKVVNELYGECFNNNESSFVLSDNGEILNISKNCLLLHNFFDLDINNKKIINELNNRVLNFISSQDLVEDFYKFNELFIKINDKIVEGFDFKIDYDSDFSYEKLVKMANFKIQNDGKFIERLISYIKIYTSLKKTKIIFFVGLSAFLLQEEIELFLKQLEYMEIKSLLIEPFRKYKLNEIGEIIIDEDLCEI